MPIKNLTLGLSLVLAGSALAHTREHHTHKTSDHSGSYVTRNGDFDWAIAHKHKITVAQLHRLNPGVDWDALPVGIHIHVPGVGGGEVTHHRSIVAHSERHSSSTTAFEIRSGDNDWLIAHHYGITVSALHRMNSSVNWDQIQPGQHIRVPGDTVGESAPHQIHTRFARIAADGVKIHRDSGKDSDVITTVDTGVYVRVLDHDGAWYKLRFPKGTEGWVRADLLKPVHQSDEDGERVARRSRRRHHSDSYVASYHRHRRHHRNSGLPYSAPDDDSLLKTASSYQGVPYAWGEMSRSGTDCSGFVKQVFHKHGVDLPRTSREQAQVGKKVTRDHLKPGDLVFFHTMRGSRVTHVGVYVGNGKFIHASSGGGKVQVNSLKDGYYANHLVGARRVKHG